MVERRVTVGWPEGLHARPAAVFVRSATALGIPLTIARPGGAPVNAMSMLRVLGLGVESGQEVILASESEGADDALDRLAKLVSEGLGALPEAL